MKTEELRRLLDPEARRAGFEAWKASFIDPCFFADHGFECDGPIESVRPMTAYGDEPVRYRMCRRHADDYREHWRDMWEEFYASQGWA